MKSCCIHKYHQRYLCRSGIYILLLFLLCSCIDSTGLCDKGGEQASTVTVTLSLPGDVNAQSMSEGDEHTVERLQVLAFRENTNSGEYYYAYAAEGKNFTLSGNLLTFEVSLLQYAEKQQFLFLANAQEAVTNASLTVGMEIEDAISELVITNATEWQAKNKGVTDWETGADASSDVVRYIPMYGRTEEIAVIPEVMNTYNLLRILSRFDIINTATNFKMVYACLFQWNDRGFVGYDPLNWNADRKTVISANIPGGTIKTKDPSFYYSADPDGKQIESSIYTFEAKGTTEHLQATALVIGGYYDGDETTICWYRADIPEFDNNEEPIEGTYGDILRNNLYLFEIDEVNGPGYPTPPEAYEGGVRVHANVQSWNLATQIVIPDGQYRFETSHSTANYDREGGAITIEVSTTHPAGLVLGNVTGGTDWLTVSPLSGTGASGIFQVTATENITGYERVGYIQVKAGNLDYNIKVVQKERRWVEGDQHQIYYKNGKEYEIIVQSISPWELEVMDDHGVLVKYCVTPHTENESKIKFTMTDKTCDELYDAAYFIFHDANGIYPPAIYPVVSMENDETAPYGPFNCLIVPVGQTIEVHSAFRKARAVWLHGDGVSGPLEDTGLSATATKSMSIIWQDGVGVVTTPGIHNNGTEQAYFTVKGNAAGNAVVGLMQEGKIIWSWHIWVVNTNDQPKDINGWLDRNLGALQNKINSTNSTSMGLLYQWGRKDPFVVSNQYNVDRSTVARFVYDASGIRITDSQTITAGSPYKSVAGIDNNLKNAIMNPFTFYTGVGEHTNRPSNSGYHGVADWYCERAYYVQHKGRFEGQCHNLWNGKAQGKMPLDPCPVGYRTPRLWDWGLDDINDEAGINNPNITQFQYWGVVSNNYGGNYHKSGWRYSSGDSFANPGIVAYYWSSTDGHKNTNEFNFHSRIIRHTTYNGTPQPYFDYIQSYGRAHGMSVRCVADDKD
ncbi:MAG: fimbria major subunit [Tannerellaceae bacterium]|nr:fimbria major subunit [Tannerellaceae bacterium]